jgi:methyltransferase (TIGR00027 family)
MSDRTASRTALATANMRAAHQLFDPQPRILEDPFAVLVLGKEAVQRIHDTAEHYQTVERRKFRAHIVLRSRFTEDRLAAAVLRGITQYVVLGAGLDTFSLRQPEWAHALKILEVDHPPTQALKRSRLVAAGLALPGNAGFATIDFERESLRDGLRRYHFSTDEPTFFSCLGVTMYLKEEAVDAMLRSVAEFPVGSEIVLTYVPPSRNPSGSSPSPLAERAASVGEPWVSYFDVDTLTAKLRGFGFSRVEPFSPSEAGQRYFQPHPGDLPVPRQTYILSAIR